MTAQRVVDKIELKKSYKQSKKLPATETDISDELLEDVFEGEDDGAAVDEEGSDFADLEDDDDEQEDEDDDLDDSAEEDDLSDEDDEASDEDDDDDDDISDEEDMSDDEDALLDEEEEKVVVAPKPIAKVTNISAHHFIWVKISNQCCHQVVPRVKQQPLATFEVENNWDEEATPAPASMQQLKQKLKAGKRPKNAGWSESSTKGEIEIVIPNKKFKGSVKLQPAQAQEAVTPQDYKVSKVFISQCNCDSNLSSFFAEP